MVLARSGEGGEPLQLVRMRFVFRDHSERLELISFIDGKSTTNIIEKILEQYGDE